VHSRRLAPAPAVRLARPGRPGLDQDQHKARQDPDLGLDPIQPGGGAYGPYTCIQGYVWRQVLPDDYTCVTPAVRSQAACDNSQAANRVARLNICVIGTNVEVAGDGFNFGPVLVEVRESNGTVVWSQQVTATAIADLPGGAYDTQTSVQMPTDPSDYYVTALDITSGRWSSQVPTNSFCS
jgi:hypothetical protein